MTRILAVAAGATPDEVLLQYGALGVVVILLIVGIRYLALRDDRRQTAMLASFEKTRQQFTADIAYERAQAEKLQQALQRLYETTQGANVEALVEVATSLNRAVHLIDDAVALVNRERRRGGLD